MQKGNNVQLKRILFGLVAFLAVFTSEIALVVGTSRFLSQGLIDLLPLLLLIVALGAIFNFGLNVLLSKKVGAAGSLSITILIELALIAVTFYFQDNLPIFLFLALLVGRLSSVVYDTSVTNLASSYANVRQSKDFLPLIRGIMDAGILSSSIYLFATTGVIKIDPLWIIFIGGVLMIMLILVISRNFDPVISLGKDHEAQTGPKEALKFIFTKSRLFVWMSWYFVLIGMIVVVFVMVYNQVFSEHLSGDDLTKFIAMVSFVTVVSRGIYNLFFYKKSTYCFGIINLMITYSVGMVLILSTMIFAPHSLWLAALLYYFHVFSYYSYLTVTTQEIFGLIPRAMNQAVFFLIKGFIPAVFALVGAGITELLVYLFPSSGLAVIIFTFLLSGLTLLAAIRIKHEFQHSLESGLNHNDEFVKAGAVDLIGERVQWEKGEKWLRKLVLDPNQSVDIRQKGIYSLVEIGNPNSIRELLLILQTEKNFRLKYYAIQSINRLLGKIEKLGMNMNVTKYLALQTFNEVYDNSQLPLPIKLEINKALRAFGFDVIIDFYRKHFDNSTNLVKASIIETIATNQDRGLISLMQPYLNNEDIHIRVEVIIGLWKFPEMRDVLLEKMKEIFRNTSDQYRMISLQLISKLNLKGMDDYVLDLIAYQNRDVSTMALIAALSLGRNQAFDVLLRKITEYVEAGDSQDLEYIYKKFYLLPDKYKARLITELKAFNDTVFSKLKDVFENSDKLFDLSLANLFTN